MKKISLFFLAFLSIVVVSFSQNFEGSVKYKIEYGSFPSNMEELKSMMPKEMLIRIKGNKSRTEQNTSMGSTISIADGDNNTITTLMSIMGKNIALKMNSDEKKPETSAAPKIVYHDETKKIADYTCKKAEIIPNESTESLIVYYTEEIQSPEIGNQYEGLKGFPMHYEMTNNGLNMTLTASEVKEEKISENEFTVPDNYEMMTMEDFKKLTGGR